MNYKLYKLLRKNIKLSEKRNPLFEQNRVAKIFLYIGFAFMCLYLLVGGTMLGWAARQGDEALIFPIMMIFLLPLDFLIRFGAQQTPTMLLKPYVLMPIKKNDIIDCFLVSSLFSSNNFIWLAFFLPYVFICGCGAAGFISALAILVILILMIIINSQWYLFVRTLVNRHIAWWIVPAIVYGAFFLPLIIDFDKGLDNMFDFFDKYAMSWSAAGIYLLVIVILFIINRKLQTRYASDEIGKVEQTNMKHVWKFSFLERFGDIGEYLKLEVKSTIRNKAIKQRFIQGLIIIAMLSAILAYTDIYSSKFAVNIWCLYCFVFFGAVNLVKIMGPEGNYIDLLMVHKENIYTLLKAKYYFYCAILLIPTLILLPPIITGKFSLLMILAYLFITSGLEYFILFQLAVYNKQSLPLNTKITGKGNFENSLQLVIELIVFFVPVALALIFTAMFGDTIGYSILIVIGLAFTLTHDLWMKNIYKRMQKRRYANLDGFHETR
ncbi:MAG: hypothetical protein IKB96_07705 [Prevotella sp.]|nr:hypothetical protein [Prevotella sp.]MBR7170952.1 hypothetical protein [Prevotella sp.]